MNIREIDAPSWARNKAWTNDLAAQGQGRFVSMHRRANKALQYVEVSFGTARRQNRTLLFCIVQDNSERRHFELLTAFRLRLLELAESVSTEKLLNVTLNEAERLTGSTIGFFNFISEDQAVLRHACSNTAKADNCGLARHPIAIDFSLSEDVIREKRAIIHNDHATLKHCNCTTVCHLTCSRELIVPIIRKGRVMATLEIGNKPVDYDENDVRLVTAIAGVAWDIISRKYAEESEMKMQEAMQYTQKMELIGQLAGGIAHDINNVLTAVLGHADMVIEEMNSDNPFAENLQNIRDSTICAANLIHQLLAFARKQTRLPKILELDMVLCKELPMLHELVGNQFRFKCRPGAHGARILMDPSQLDQIVTNLCANARDAIGEEGSVTIETSTVRVQQSECYTGHACQTPGDFAVIAVTDTGSGIDPNVLPHIFEPFFSTKEVGKGSGLGLSTVYGIVKQNKGYLDCQSDPGRGTRFTLYLPLFDETAGRGGQALPDGMTGLVGRKTVLLISNDPSIIQLIGRVLEKNGFGLISAPTPHEGLKLATRSEAPVDLLMTDVVMPEMNGRELAARLHLRYPEMKTLFMSAYTVEHGMQKNSPKTGTRFIRKPFKVRELTDTVRAMLG